MVKNQRDFNIAFVGLKPGSHEFFYTLGSEELEKFSEHFEIEDPEAIVKLVLDKKDTFLDLKFDSTLKGKTYCDRCGGDLLLDVWDESELILKLSSNADKENETNDQDDILFIARGESIINVYDWIIEVLAVMIPMSKSHEAEKCDPEVISKLNEMTQKENKKNIWKDLDNIKFEQ